MLNRIRQEPALVAGTVQAVLGLAAAFGAGLTAEQTGAVLAFTAAVLALVVRANVTPTGRNWGRSQSGPDGGAGEARAVLVTAAAIVLAALIVGLLRMWFGGGPFLPGLA